MFDLEKSIKNWRKRLRKHPGLEPGYIEELESHLRDKIDTLNSRENLSEQAAFEKAVRQMQDVDEIAEEYHRARTKAPTEPPWKTRSRITTLLPNFLKITLRNMKRKKGYAFINIFGLAIGLAACLLMVLYIRFELSFDQFHSNKNQIYRVVTPIYTSEGSSAGKVQTNGWPIGQLLEQNYPEIKNSIYIRSESHSIKHDNHYYFENTLIASRDFLTVFDFDLLKGNPQTALSQPNSIVITRDLKTKYFGDRPALGQSLVIEDSLQYTVTGVAENVPENSHIQFDALFSFSGWVNRHPTFNTSSHWLDLNMHNYVKVRKGTDIKGLKAKIKNIYMDGAGSYFKDLDMRPEVNLEPLGDVYLYSDYGNGLGPQSDINYLYLLGGIALFVLVIACINFMNLSTARSLERAKEVGIRKVVGSDQKTLITQFLTESTLTAFFGMLLAIALAIWGLPYFNALTQNSFTYADLISPAMGLTLLGFIGIVGFLAGLYPAFILSDFKPVQVLKDSYIKTGRGASLRKGLVVFQFAISGFLIMCTIVVVKQLHYMQNQELGFEKDQIAVLDARRTGLNSEQNKKDTYRTLKQELLNSPNISQVSATLAPPGRSGWRSILAYGEGQTPDQRFSIEYLPVDYNYIPMFDLKVLAGRTFSKEHGKDAREGVVINKAAVQQFEWKNAQSALGKHVTTLNSLLDDPVIGVIDNYHHHGLQEKIQPLVMVIEPQYYKYIAVKFSAQNASNVIDHMKATWKQFFPGYSFDYFFLDREYAQQYQQQRRLAGVYGTFAVFAIVIACLGLFGLTAFSTAKRTKEIGIRKVLGASVQNIILLISRDFLWLVGLAFLIASPLAYLFMSNWLQDFAFRTSIGFGIFLITALVYLLITVLTISWQSVKAALTNPVNSLRSE